ncbi:MAG: ABC transporter permease [Actinomycetota bacterium]
MMETKREPKADEGLLTPGAAVGERRLFADIAPWGPVVAFALMFLAFGLLSGETFLTRANLLTVVNDQAVLAIVAFGLTVVLLTGEFDLSIGAMMSLAGALSAGFVAITGLPVGLAIVIVLAIGALIGLVNGVLVTLFRVPALVATIAMASVLDGITLWYTDGEVIFQGIPRGFIQIGRATVLGVQTPTVFLIAFAVILFMVLKYTATGRSIHAIGGNREAARMSGIRVSRYVILAFVVSGLCAAFAGLLQAARNGSAVAFMGNPFLLPAFAAAFLGSVTLRRGQFHILGTVIGVYFVAIGTNGLFILGFPFWVKFVFSGAILILATAGSRFLKRRG